MSNRADRYVFFFVLFCFVLSVFLPWHQSKIDELELHEAAFLQLLNGKPVTNKTGTWAAQCAELVEAVK